MNGPTRNPDPGTPGRAEDDYRYVLEFLPNPVWHVDANGQCDWLNRAWYAFTGRTPEEELGQGWARGIHPDDQPACLEEFRAAVPAHRPFAMEYRLRNRNGDYRWMSSYGGPIFDHDGEFTGYIGASYDIHEKRTLRLGLEKKQAFLDAVLEGVDSVILACEADGQLSTFNRATRELLGEPLPSLPIPLQAWAACERLRDAESGAPLPVSALPLVRALEGEHVRDEEICMLGENGQRHRVLVNARPLFGSDGASVGAVVTGRDVTAERAAERRLRCDHARQRVISRILSLSLSNLPLRAKLEQSLEALLEEDSLDIGGAQACLRLALEQEGWTISIGTVGTAGFICHLDFPVALDHNDELGRFYFTASAPCSPMLPDFLRMVSALLANTVERHRWEEKVVQFSRAIEQSNAAVVITEAEGRILYVNPTLCRITGYAADEVIGRHPAIFSAADTSVEVFQEIWDTISEGRYWQGELQFRRKDGSVAWQLAVISPLRDAQGEVVNFVAVLEDLSFAKRAERERQELEQRLAQAEKMEAIGHLVGGIAHDFNNILVAILGFTELAQRQFGHLDPLLGTYLEHSLQASQRAKHLVAQLLAFGRTKAGELRPAAPGPIVREVVELLGSTLPSSFGIHVFVAEELPHVRVDSVQLHQVLMNLCINARDATGGRGRLDIAVFREVVRNQVCESCRRDFDGDFVTIRMADDGKGMNPEERKRIFEPFFSTKEPGMGSGMGLSVVHGIVHFHGGHLTLNTAVEQGAEFRIHLPVVDAPPQVAEAAPVRRMGPVSGRVLLLDDEPAVAEFMRSALIALGLDVTVHGDSLDAWEHFSRDPQAFDLVITDETMPNLPGSELATRMLDVRPDLPVILCTGYSTEVDEVRALSQGVRRFLMKPMSVAELQRIVTDLLAKRTERWPEGDPRRKAD